MDLLVQYYRRQAGRGREDMGPIYSTQPFIRRGHRIGSILAGLFRTLRPILRSGAKSLGKEAFKTLGREALRIGGNIIRDIAENPPTQTTDIISKYVATSTQNIISCVEVWWSQAKESIVNRCAKCKTKENN
jgi:hypothetical protein